MAAPMSLSTFISSAVTLAIARGVTGTEALATVRREAADHWYNDLDSSYSGEPRGSSAPN